MMNFQVKGRQCHIFGSGKADCCIICGMGNHTANETENTAKLLYENITPDICTLIVFETENWNGDFSPWQAEAIFGDEPFTGNAPHTLEWIQNALLPYLRKENIINADCKKYIAGYSLSGLFAVWAFLKSDIFDGAASCSGSLWFPGWMEYIENHRQKQNGIVYLSLGSKEEKTKNKLMTAVGDNTRNTYRILKDSSISKVTLEWNKGGHFSNPTQRLVKGMLWLLRQK